MTDHYLGKKVDDLMEVDEVANSSLKRFLNVISLKQTFVFSGILG